ncbi:MAG: L-threonylcarbamoyladenylate synthase [Eubacteriales bacterium]|jgi:L-threonylcarbamoyladenylate synthase
MAHAKIVKMTEDHLDMDALCEAGEILKRGGLVAFPTETVYGLGGNALDPEASKKIYAAKGRPSDNPLIVHIAEFEDLFPLVTSVPDGAYKLAAAYWPGPLTMIFNKSSIVPLETTGGLETVAVRFPDNEIAREMIRQGGGYVAAPSANTSGRPSPTLASHVDEDLGDRIDMILDGGQVHIGLESTIVDFTEDVPVILRPGFLNQEMLEKVLGEVRVDPGIMSENVHVRPKAPGMRYKHYAPKADLAIVEGKPEDVFAKIRDLTAERIAEGKKVGVICTEESRNEYPEGDVRCIGSRSDDRTIAHHLYEILRDFDADGVDYIYTESFETPRMGQAIMNRLIKAAGHEVIDA